MLGGAFGKMVQVYDGKVRIKTAAKQNAETRRARYRDA